jgi:Lon protease-like protein
VVLERLPIFPLPNAHLFPHALLPLHVFEERYRALTRDCLDGERRMAIALLEPGHDADYEGRPPVRAVCGVGEIVAHHRHPDGRFDLLLRGTARARILEELPPTFPFRVVRAELLADRYPQGVDLALARSSLVALCDRLAGALPTGGETLRELARQEDDPAAAADVLAAALVLDAAARQELVEMVDVAARLERVSATVAEMLARLDAGGARN